VGFCAIVWSIFVSISKLYIHPKYYKHFREATPPSY
jgi:hypothetical protein